MNKYASNAPFIHTEKNAPYIYLTIIAALVPCVSYAIFYYGLRALILILFSALMFALSDISFSIFAHRHNRNEYFDLSSIVSGLVFALMLPPNTPIYIAFIGVVFGSCIIKQFFGGAGSTIANPAAGAILFVRLLFPSEMYGYAQATDGWFDVGSLIYGSTSQHSVPDYSGLSFAELVSGNFAGTLGAACAVMAIFGVLFMIVRGSIRLYAPGSYLIMLTLLYVLFRPIGDYPVFIFTSGAVFVAVFMLGDMTTMPSRFIAGAFAGIVCAMLTFVLYIYIDHEVAIIAPVVAVNLMSFVIDFFAKTVSRRSKGSREVDVL